MNLSLILFLIAFILHTDLLSYAFLERIICVSTIIYDALILIIIAIGLDLIMTFYRLRGSSFIVIHV